MSHAFPKWFTCAGWIVYIPAFLLTLREMWEKTILTWQEGPQMIGFTMVHQYTILFLIGSAGIVLCVLWIFIAMIFLFIRRRTILIIEKIQFVVVVFTIAINFIPYSFWKALG